MALHWTLEKRTKHPQWVHLQHQLHPPGPPAASEVTTSRPPEGLAGSLEFGTREMLAAGVLACDSRVAASDRADSLRVSVGWIGRPLMALRRRQPQSRVLATRATILRVPSRRAREGAASKRPPPLGVAELTGAARGVMNLACCTRTNPTRTCRNWRRPRAYQRPNHPTPHCILSLRCPSYRSYS